MNEIGLDLEREAKQLTRLSREEAEDRLGRGENLENCDLSGLDLSGLDFEGKSFRGSDLRR